MSPFSTWLARVLSDGESVQDEAPHLSAADRPGVLATLRAAFDRHALDVAGPPIAFDPDAALGAAVALARACWLLVGGEGESPTVGVEPHAAGAHLSADVCLRFLPAVLSRARVRAPEGEPAVALDRLLRTWPLSGVRADLDGVPATPLEFDGHPGLQLLYAERLIRTARPEWVPAAGTAREWVERVFAERGRSLPAPPPEVSARE
jgi:hypothetical protein